MIKTEFTSEYPNRLDAFDVCQSMMLGMTAVGINTQDWGVYKIQRIVGGKLVNSYVGTIVYLDESNES